MIRFRVAFILTVILLCIAFFAFNDYPPIPSRTPWQKNDKGRITASVNDANAFHQPADTNGVEAANATLGFGAIFVVSGPNSPRRERLEQAASVTELDLRIPKQKVWTAEDLHNFRGKPIEQSKIGDGSIMAWLSHHLVLREFLESGAETALILEDDVDWDIRLRSVQIPLAQQAIRKLFYTPSEDSAKYPWGRQSDWDLLWIGHCSDTWVPWGQPRGLGHFHPETLAKVNNVVYEDETVGRFHELHPWTSSLLASFGIHEKHRVIHTSKFTLCSFAYAVTRESAQRLLSELAPASENLMPDYHAWDVALLSNTRGNLTSFTLQPELFHHHGASDSAIGKAEGNPFISEEAVTGSENEYYYQHTSNVQCSFGPGSQMYPNGDLKKLERLREYARKGKCPRTVE